MNTARRAFLGNALWIFDLKLGPSRDGVITPRVTFHWDATQAKWISSGLAPEVSCRISESGRSAWAQAINEGKLTVPRAPPKAAENPARLPWEILPADEYSRPWRPHSLAGRSHGEEKAGSRAHFERMESALNKPNTADFPGIPGLSIESLSPPDGYRQPVFSEQERQQFAPLDALFEEQSKLGSEQTHQERALAALRDAVSETSRLLDLRDDPAGLEKWARENRWLGGFPLERLVRIAPARAAAVLRERLPNAEPMDADMIREALARLAPGVPVPDEWPEAALAGQRPPHEDEIAQLSARSPFNGSLNFRAFVNWATTLVPPDEPRSRLPSSQRGSLSTVRNSASC